MMMIVNDDDDEKQVEQEVSREIEADTFFAFKNLMSETKDLFIQQMDSSTSGMYVK